MLDVKLLGKFQVYLDGEPLEIASQPAQSLLAYLILNAHKSYRRENLAGLLWPDSDETNARNNLRQALWRLRKSVGEEFFLADRTSLGFNAQADYRLDVDRLQTEIDDGTPVETLAQTVAVYTDSLLPGFYEDWVMLAQERLQAIYENRMELLLARLIEETRWREVRDWAEQWIARGQVPEPAYRALMTAAAGLGDQAGVAAAFQRCVEALKAEVGVEPSPETQDLFDRLTSGEALPQANAKDTNPTPPVKLPIQPTPFIGREAELSQLATLLADPDNRLVTVLGPGGIGKTRLVIEAARAQGSAFAHGVYFVSLAAEEDPNLVATPIADAINFTFHLRNQHEKWERESENEQLLAYLHNKQMLLVLDNLEHLAEGIPFVADLLQSADGVKLLATSRERLGLRGETVFPVGSMLVSEKVDEDSQTTSDRSDAVRLFVRCAQRVRPDFEVAAGNLGDIIAICQLVDGLPLGIELAAAWVGLLTPQEIAAEIKTNLDFLTSNLRDVPDRQQSIRSVFESSWNRLTEPEQDVFRQLSVFRGGFTRRAAKRITGATLQTLMSLVNKSLIQPDYRGRYRIHELLRQFGVERLAASPERETETRNRHCAYYAAFLKQREPDINGQNQRKALREINIEIDNINRAWKWAVAQHNLKAIDDAMESLCEFHRIRGSYEEGYDLFPPAAKVMGWQGFGSRDALPDTNTMFSKIVELLNQAKAASSGTLDRHTIQGKLLARFIRFHCESPRNDWLACDGRHQAMQILSQAGARREMAYLLRYLAHVWFTPQQARYLYRQALEIFEEYNDTRGIAETLYRLGMVAAQVGQYREAERLFQDSMANLQKLGRSDAIATCLGELGYVLWAVGDYQQAEVRCEEGLAVASRVGYQTLAAIIQNHLARLKIAVGDDQAAKQLLQTSLASFKEIGLRGMQADTLGQLAHLAAVTKDFSRARQLAEESLAICDEIDHGQGLVEPFIALGEVSLGSGDWGEAESHFQKALKTAGEIQMPPLSLHVLAGLARLLAAVGEKVRAFEAATLTLHHPASWQWSRDSVAPLAAELETVLPSEAVAEIHRRVREKTFEEMIERITVYRLPAESLSVEPDKAGGNIGTSGDAAKISASTAVSAPPQQNQSPDRYEILDALGQGGFAVVYRARDTELERHVALKELRASFLADREWVSRFRQEARAIARLDHPGIVTIHDIGQNGDRLFIVMRLVEGPTLAERIAAEGRLAWSETVEIITVIAKALDYAHAQQFIHRDLKPENILLDPERGPLLTDFGLAKLVSENSMSQSGSIVGTPHYIAPEVWEGQAAGVQSDIYALGCILYEMLTGQKLFRGASPPAVMMAHFQPPALPQQWPDGVPTGLTEVLAPALAGHPDERYPSASMLAQALRRLSHDDGHHNANENRFNPHPPPSATPSPDSGEGWGGVYPQRRA